MQKAGEGTVLGDFHGARFSKDGVTSVFSVKDGKYGVRTEGADGKLQDLNVAWTFGFSPLQQYLVPFPNGRLQSLALAWDSRARIARLAPPAPSLRRMFPGDEQR